MNYYWSDKLKDFEYKKSETIDDLEEVLNEYGEKAKILAGGTNLIPALRMKVLPETPDILVDIKDISDLDYIEENGEEIKIGALQTLSEIQENEKVKEEITLLAEASKSTLTPQIRNLSTIAGDISQELNSWYLWNPNPFVKELESEYIADEGMNQYLSIFGGAGVNYAVNSSEIATALAALEADIETTKRSIPIGEFYTDNRGFTSNTVLDSDEVIKEINVPKPEKNTEQIYKALKIRKSVDRPLVSVALAVVLTDSGSVEECRIAIGSVAPEPKRAVQAEELLQGKEITEDLAEKASEEAVKNTEPLSKNAYKVQMTKAEVKKSLLELI